MAPAIDRGRRPARIAIAAVGLFLSTQTFASGATALCASPGPTPFAALATGRLLFVGVVESVSNLDRWANVHVEEVWSSDDLAEWVQVRGTENEPDPFGIFANISSIDNSFTPGGRYLFFPTIRDGHLYDIGCGDNASFPWDPSFEALRPATAHPPIVGSPPQPGIPWMLVGLGAVVLLVSGVLLGLRRNARKATTA